MREIYVATFLAAAISGLIASHLFALAAFGAARSELLVCVRSGVCDFLVALKKYLDRRIASMIAHRAREAATFGLRHFSELDPKQVDSRANRLERICTSLDCEPAPLVEDRTSADAGRAQA